MDTQYPQTQRNRRIVSTFLLGVVGFTCIMTFLVGPLIMGMRNEVENRQILYKCRSVVDANTMMVQLRVWERPNPAPEVAIRMAGLDVPPLADAEDPGVIAWAETHGVSPQHAATMARSAERTLVAFARMQNMVLQPADGSDLTLGLEDGSLVHVFVTGTDVAYKQLQQGLAAHDSRIPHLYEERYASAEAEAKAAGRGLWSEMR
ncbi:MAG: thermonuclease family protein [Kiritimatiellae bacterium]|nr:thermonuclease family protein [Kiritimatiellia bacterium]